MPRVVFTPSGLDAEVEVGVTVLDAARRMGVDLDSVCGGRGICGRCVVSPAIGSFAKWAITVDAEPPRSSLEDAYSLRKPLNGRLGCQLIVGGDAIYDVPPTSQVHRPVVRKSIDLGDLVVDPIIRLTYVEVERPELGDDRSTVERIGDFDAPIHLLNRLVREGGCTVAAAGRRVVGVWPGYVDAIYGVAIDIGSTTVAGHLCDLHTGEVVASGGRMNPQIRFGEDLMSRVSYVMMNPGGDVALTSVIRDALNELIAELAVDIGLDKVVEVVLVGNPIMHHIVLGIDPTPLGTAPFDLAVSTAVTGRARDIGLHLDADLYMAPCIAGHHWPWQVGKSGQAVAA